MCNDVQRTVEIRFTTGELKQHLNPRRKSGKVRKGLPDYLEWEVGKEAQSGQYADYEILAGRRNARRPADPGALSPFGPALASTCGEEEEP